MLVNHCRRLGLGPSPYTIALSCVRRENARLKNERDVVKK